MNLNRRAARIASRLVRDADFFGIRTSKTSSGATIVDCGVEAPGGFAAGLALARICLGGLGSAAVVPSPYPDLPGPAVRVATDRPLQACMASQYAGWKLQAPGFFAMGSGPMRTLGSQEKLFDEYDLRESSSVAVGVLESRKLPGEEVVAQIADACKLSPSDVMLLVAPTASVAGALQVVARSVETTMHKLETLGVDLRIVRHGYGVAPLPAVGTNDLVALGRTNDAILYGADVTLWVDCDDALIAEFGPRVPSESSRDYGEPFGKLFDRYDRDFYKIDPHLFSPAVARFVNLQTGRTHSFGTLRPDLLVYDA
ncbi:MAG TPA: methenyltetrahydromethanopterin cyclohydrolase [Pirellulaceae bacterium]|jgi:methenyltetrahydromethanopterin cyclohydrolase|nr:methenyltetrahydromethanopterin cyclohydrolase [Pirellulaceae bacterium]